MAYFVAQATQTHRVTEDDPELVTLTPPSPDRWGGEPGPPCLVSVAPKVETKASEKPVKHSTY